MLLCPYTVEYTPSLSHGGTLSWHFLRRNVRHLFNLASAFLFVLLCLLVIFYVTVFYFMHASFNCVLLMTVLIK